MTRTLQTAQIGLGWLLDRGVCTQLRGEWQGMKGQLSAHQYLRYFTLRSRTESKPENSDKPCDTGTPVKELMADFPHFNFQTVFPDYPEKTGRWAFSRSAIMQRGNDCRRWLKSRPENVIAVVSHSGFLRVGISHTRYANADCRVFQFKDGHGDELVEWELTESRRGGMGNSEKGKAYAEPSDFPFERELEPETIIETKAQEEVTEEIPRGPWLLQSFRLGNICRSVKIYYMPTFEEVYSFRRFRNVISRTCCASLVKLDKLYRRSLGKLLSYNLLQLLV